MGRGRVGYVPADLDDFDAASGNPDLFQPDAHHSHPLLNAPITEPRAVTLYLDGEPTGRTWRRPCASSAFPRRDRLRASSARRQSRPRNAT